MFSEVRRVGAGFPMSLFSGRRPRSSFLSRVRVKLERGRRFRLTLLNCPKLRLGVGAVSRYVYREKLNWDKWTSEHVRQARATVAF